MNRKTDGLGFIHRLTFEMIAWLPHYLQLIAHELNQTKEPLVHEQYAQPAMGSALVNTPSPIEYSHSTTPLVGTEDFFAARYRAHGLERHVLASFDFALEVVAQRLEP